MTMRWFGESWHSPVNEELQQVEVPLFEVCAWCEEPIAPGDRGLIYSNGPVAHLCCFLRGIFGSVAHIQKRCSCYVPGSTCGDPENMTKREAAEAAVAAYYKSQEK